MLTACVEKELKANSFSIHCASVCVCLCMCMCLSVCLCEVTYLHCVSKKSSHLNTLCNFVKSQPIFTLFVLLESIRNLLQKSCDTCHIVSPVCDISHLTLGVLLHYLGKLKIQISGHLSTVSVSRNVFNILLTPSFVQHFSRNSSATNLFAVYPFKYNFLLKSCPHR